MYSGGKLFSARYVSTALLYLMLASQAVGTSEPREQLSQHAGLCALRPFVVLTDGLYEILNAKHRLWILVKRGGLNVFP